MNTELFLEFMNKKLKLIFANFEKARYDLVMMKSLTIRIPYTEWVAKVLWKFIANEAILINLNGQMIVAVHGRANIRYISDP